MQIIRCGLILAAILSSQTVFAHGHSKACESIAKACVDAGYTRADTADKKFWQGCMKPVILGQSVQGVTIDAKTATTCRTDKIEELKKDLNELENVSTKS